MSVERRALDIILSNRYLNLATCRNGRPWVAALAYSLSNDLDFFFYSAVRSRHIEDLGFSEDVAICIYDSSLGSDDVDGLQADAKCKLVEDEDLEWVVPQYYEFSFPDLTQRKSWWREPGAFAGLVPQKFFRISIKNLYVIDLEHTEVDGRATVDMRKVREMYAQQQLSK